MTRKTISHDECRNSRKIELDKRRGRVKCPSRKIASFYGKYGRKYTLSSRAQEVLSTVLEDMIEETLEDARKLAQGTGKNKVAIEDVEMAMVNLCQRLYPQSNSQPDDIPVEYDPPKKSNQQTNHHQRDRDQDPLKNTASKQSLE